MRGAMRGGAGWRAEVVVVQCGGGRGGRGGRHFELDRWEGSRVNQITTSMLFIFFAFNRNSKFEKGGSRFNLYAL